MSIYFSDTDCKAESIEAIADASRDYGGIEFGAPRSVLRPESAGDLAVLIAAARREGFAVAARGRGHSVRGQSLAPGGVVVDMRSLAKVELCAGNALDVGAGADWASALSHVLPCGLWPPVLPNYLGLSIGGTVSVGGIGEATFRHGFISGAAISLEAVTGCGEILICSAEQNPELFAALQGGLGQFAMITRARISLVPAPSRLRSFHLLYAEVEEFLEDFERLARNDSELRGLRGLAIPNRGDYLAFFLGPAGSSGWSPRGVPPHRFPHLFLMTATYGGDEPAAISGGFLSDLQYIPGASRTEELSGEEIALSPPVNRAPAHPWVDLLIPRRGAAPFLRDAMALLPMDDIGGPVLLYPILPERTRASSCRLPEDDFVVLLSVSRAIDPTLDPRRRQQELSAALEQNRELYRRCRRIGGLSYPIGSLGLQPEDWRDHFGAQWQRLQELKERYDPDRILAPGQHMFSNFSDAKH
jgi:FAD/FMN-containing dehydrogenase